MVRRQLPRLFVEELEPRINPGTVPSIIQAVGPGLQNPGAYNLLPGSPGNPAPNNDNPVEKINFFSQSLVSAPWGTSTSNTG